MTPSRKIHFVASETEDADSAVAALQEQYGQYELEQADVIVALGGDGFMLRTLHRFLPAGLPVYGMKLGKVGFLMNRFREDDLQQRLDAADVVELNPLCMIAMTEAVNNAIVHGNKLDSNKMVDVRVSVDGPVLEFRIADEGPGFDFENIPDPTSPENIEKPNGRGVFLMRQLADTCEFEELGRVAILRFEQAIPQVESAN